MPQAHTQGTPQRTPPLVALHGQANVPSRDLRLATGSPSLWGTQNPGSVRTKASWKPAAQGARGWALCGAATPQSPSWGKYLLSISAV